jgi:3-dehydroquinate dehydratase-1
MAHAVSHWQSDTPQVVGSFGTLAALQAAKAPDLLTVCDLAEIRLDLLTIEGWAPTERPWAHLVGIVPLLFTARRKEEGGALDWDAPQRSHALESVLDDATLIDIEVASLESMATVLEEARKRQIPCVASFHNFQSLPTDSVLEHALTTAHAAGATIFKIAAAVASPADLARLADFQLKNHPLPVSTMGMGKLAPVSRLLCAQCGSILNYGYLGETPTAPGQWDSGLLKSAIARLTPHRLP